VYPGTPHVPGSQIRPRSHALVFMLHAHRSRRAGRKRCVAAMARLDASFLSARALGLARGPHTDRAPEQPCTRNRDHAGRSNCGATTDGSHPQCANATGSFRRWRRPGRVR
jgi:hypothetical protein